MRIADINYLPANLEQSIQVQCKSGWYGLMVSVIVSQFPDSLWTVDS